MRDTVSSCCSGVESLVLAGTGRLSHRGVNKEVCLRASESPGTFTYAHDHPCTASQRSYGDAIDHDLDEISDVAGHVDPISADSSYLQRQFPDVSRNTARVLFTSLSDMDTTLSIEEKKPVNAEVAKALAMNLYHNSAEFLQAYRTLKFGTVQRIYRRYFLKWLQMHEQGGTRNAFTQTSVCIAEHATLATGLSSDEESERLRSQSPVPALVSRSLMSKYGRNASTRRCEELGMKSVVCTQRARSTPMPPSRFGHASSVVGSVSLRVDRARHELTRHEVRQSVPQDCVGSSVYPRPTRVQYSTLPCIRLPILTAHRPYNAKRGTKR
uniref:Uncharacterized protein n=1 Tax=Trypanosoma vivax (strain Y486) TaxID=1055687 RepID=G0TZM2_TRYVY|nr:conserved hypothetical protein [Trypanosoma vivax Y486]